MVVLATRIAAFVYQDATMTQHRAAVRHQHDHGRRLSDLCRQHRLVSFGHIAFMAIGAYATAIVSMDPFDKLIGSRTCPSSCSTCISA